MSIEQAVQTTLAEHPWSNKREVLRSLRSSGVKVVGGVSEVNSVLYRLERAGAVVHRGSSPPEWCLGSPVQLDRAVRKPVASFQRATVAPATLARTGLPLRSWQHEAVGAWERSGRRGVVEAVTGTGKTQVGVEAVWGQLGSGGKALVVVPTRALLHQWDRTLVEYFGANRVGRNGDGHADSFATKDVVVSTIHSAPFVRLGGARGVIVADECHRYGSETWHGNLSEDFEARLGLTATYHRNDPGDQRLAQYFGRSVFQIDYERAIADEVVTRFRIAFVGVELSQSDRAEYDERGRRCSKARSTLLDAGFPKEPFGEFMRQVAIAAKSHPSDVVQTAARRYAANFAKRRAILADSSGKLARLRALEPAVAAATGTLVFTQTKSAAIQAASMLTSSGHPASAVYGDLDGDQREHLLGAFRDRDTTVLTAPRVLDEGIDVPEADLGVILSASSSKRQMIQRMGRVLRLKHDGRTARLAILFAEGTVEDPREGAHEGFIDIAWDVAEEASVFSSSASGSSILDFLRPTFDGPVAPSTGSRGSAPSFPSRLR